MLSGKGTKRVTLFLYIFVISIILLMTSTPIIAASIPPEKEVVFNNFEDYLHLEYDKAYVITFTGETEAPGIKFDKLNAKVDNTVYLQLIKASHDRLFTYFGIYLTDGVSSPQGSVNKENLETKFSTKTISSPRTPGLEGLKSIDYGTLSLVDTEKGIPDPEAYMTVRVWVEEYKEDKSAAETPATETPAVVKTVKAKNPMTVKGKTATVKYSIVKRKAQSLKITKALTIRNAKGTVTFTKISGNKKIVINRKTGKITIKKGLKKNSYKVKVKVKAAGNKKYKPITKTVVFKIKIK